MSDVRPNLLSARQADVLNALQEVFLAEGFRHLTIGDMAGLAHTSRRTLYQLGQSKEEVVVGVIDRFFNGMGKDALRRAQDAARVHDQIEAYLSASVERNRRASRQFIHDVENYAPTRHVYDRHQEIAIRELESIVRKAMQRGEVTEGTPALWAEMLGAVIRRLRDPEVLDRVGASRGDALELFGHFCRRGLA
ncbi:TetR/AcrR family transcriptional regulator [Streptosporangium sp. NPDC001681]|uniref:TetR/AcrR family transcriptional regulator n=1 Tax=Streptosporangium sp. NPDC001681 TaxID=3154395 RepID=UPI00332404DF